MATKIVRPKSHKAKSPKVKTGMRTSNVKASQSEFDRILKAMLRPNPAKKTKKKR